MALLNQLYVTCVDIDSKAVQLFIMALMCTRIVKVMMYDLCYEMT